jgi:hypothetical protein
MTPSEARRRIISEEWLANLQKTLTRMDELITQSRARIAEHAAMMEDMDRNSPELYTVSRDLHINLEQGLLFLLEHRATLRRELNYIERRKAAETDCRQGCRPRRHASFVQ